MLTGFGIGVFVGRTHEQAGRTADGVERGQGHRHSYAERTFRKGPRNDAQFGIYSGAGHRFNLLHQIGLSASLGILKGDARLIQRGFFVFQHTLALNVVNAHIYTEINSIADVESQVEIILLHTTLLSTMVVISLGIPMLIVRHVSRGIADGVDQKYVVAQIGQRSCQGTVGIYLQIQPAFTERIGQFTHLPSLRDSA